METDVAYKVRVNIRLPESKPLLPLFEAVVNSFLSIEDAAVESGRIEIKVYCESILRGEGMECEGIVDGFMVSDNGVGFNNENFHHFFISDTSHRASRGGKGLGRFSWLKAFDFADIESHYPENGYLLTRRFRFTISGTKPNDNPQPSALRSALTTVKLSGMREPYRSKCPQQLGLIGHRIVEHCLPFFIKQTCPTVLISDEYDSLNLNDYYKTTFAANSVVHQFALNGMDFSLRGMRLYQSYEKHHRLIYAANYREVKPDRLDKFIFDLQRRITDENGKPFLYLGFVEGEYLNSKINNERTDFSFDEDSEDDPGTREITLEHIRNECLGLIRSDLKPFLEDINTEKKRVINDFIRHEAPRYRVLSRYIDEFIMRVPPGTTGKKLEGILHQELYEREQQIKDEWHVLIEGAEKQDLKPEDYEAKVNEFIARADEIGKSSLAEYVAHRKIMLQFLEKSLQRNTETGKYEKEDIIHRIIYPKRFSSDVVPYEQQNLWIIDEKLSYHWFLVSDNPLSSEPVLNEESAMRPDIAIFDQALAFSERKDGLIDSVVIIEFKKPDRTEYKKENPIDQVMELIKRIKSNKLENSSGRKIEINRDYCRFFAYIICDLTEPIENLATVRGFHPMSDKRGFYFHNDPMSTYIEIISYSKLLDEANRRNKILFDKLLTP